MKKKTMACVLEDIFCRGCTQYFTIHIGENSTVLSTRLKDFCTSEDL